MNLKSFVFALVAVIALSCLSLTTQAGQNFTAIVAQALNTGNLVYLSADNQGALLTGQGASTSLNVSTTTVIQSGAGRVGRVSVLVAGAAGALYDNNSTSTGNTAANEIAVIPATQGSITVDFPFTSGLVYVPGASQVASISYDK